MNPHTPFPEACARCEQTRQQCACEPPCARRLNTRVVVVMHHREAARHTPTAPFLQKAFEGTAVFLSGVRGQPLDLEFLHSEGRRVLYLSPSSEARILGKELLNEEPRSITLVVPDGNTRQAARIGRRVPGLIDAEHVTLAPALHGQLCPGGGAFAALGLTTVEAVLRALPIIEPGEDLDRLRRSWVRVSTTTKFSASSRSRLSSASDAVPLRILYQDEHLVAVDKPAGVAVHRGWSHDAAPLLQTLRDQLERRVYPAHRLDRATSGVLLFAQSPEVAREVQSLFESGRVEKRYLALCRGHGFTERIVDHALSHEGGPKKPARTRLSLLGTFERYGLLEAIPETGRTHQIRKHLKHIAHPIIGDVRYGKGEHNRTFRERFGFHRLALHCYALHLPHPRTSEVLHLTAPPSGDFERLLGELNLGAISP